MHSLLRQQRWELALAQAEALGQRAQITDDSLLAAHSKLCRAQALSRLGHVGESLELTASLSSDIHNLPRGFLAQYEMCLGTAAAMMKERDSADVHYRRAALVLESLHNVPGQIDLKWNLETLGVKGNRELLGLDRRNPANAWPNRSGRSLPTLEVRDLSQRSSSR